MAKNLIAICLAISILALQYFQPIEFTWLGHDAWASSNLQIGAFLGAPIGLFLFLIRRIVPIWLSWLIIILSLALFVCSAATSIYWALNLNDLTDISDQIFYRDTIWRMAHLIMLVFGIVFIYSMCLLEKIVKD